MNRTTIIGNLGSDAEVRTTQSGKNYLSFSVAVSEGTGEQKTTTWFSCSGWGERFVNGRIGEFLKKGTKVFLEGRLTPSIFQRQDGSSEISMNLMVNNLELLGGQPTAQGQPQAQQQAQAQAPTQTPTQQNAQHRPNAFPNTPQPSAPQHDSFGNPLPVDDDLPF